MNWILEKYKNQFAIYCKESKCFVLFGTKKKMQIMLNELNK